MGNAARYENLECWQQAKSLAVEIFRISTDGSLKNDLWLLDRMRGTAVSIASDIAEGRECRDSEGFMHHLHKSKATAAELRTQLLISREIGYLSEGDFLDFEDRINRLCAMLGGLIRSIRNRTQAEAQPEA